VVVDALSASPGSSPGFLRRHRLKIVLIAFVGVLVGLAALWTLITLTFSYSDGDRVGYIQKFSRKGWICRTWEGEIAMSPVPGALPQIFDFTVRDDAVAKKMKGLEGRKISIHYKEKRGVPSSCFGDTSYFVSDVRELSQ
jgi:hypothetical protein